MATSSGVCESAWDNSECEGNPLCPPRCPRFVDREGTPHVVRLYEPSLHENLVSMYENLDASDYTMGIPPSHPAGIDAWITGLVESGWNLVSTCGEEVTGHVAVAPADASAPDLVVFVHRDFQRRGIGTELLKQMIARAKAAEYEKINLDVSSRNETALSVYHNLSFQTIEMLSDRVEMELPLDDPTVDRYRLPPAER